MSWRMNNFFRQGLSHSFSNMRSSWGPSFLQPRGSSWSGGHIPSSLVHFLPNPNRSNRLIKPSHSHNHSDLQFMTYSFDWAGVENRNIKKGNGTRHMEYFKLPVFFETGKIGRAKFSRQLVWSTQKPSFEPSANSRHPFISSLLNWLFILFSITISSLKDDRCLGILVEPV